MAHEAGHGTLSSYSWVNHLIGFTLHTVRNHFLSIKCPLSDGLSSSFSFHTMHGDQLTMLTTRPRCLLNVTKTMFLEPAAITASPLKLQRHSQTTMKSLKKRLSIPSSAWFLCNFLAGNITFLQTSWAHQCILPERMWVTYTSKETSKILTSLLQHFQPSSPLFKPHERNGIIASNIGLTVMASILYLWTQQVGLGYFFKLYFVPYLVSHWFETLWMYNDSGWQLSNHWIVMLTYLHHSDPTIAHYRNKQWSFLRGAISTVDRPLLGWAGRFFLHNVSHDHVRKNYFCNHGVDDLMFTCIRLHIICFLLFHFVSDYRQSPYL